MKNNIIINGIDDIIKGLTTIKGAMLVADEKEILKELVAELLPELKETIHSDSEVQKTITEEPVEVSSEENELEELELDEKEELEEVSTEEPDKPYSRKELEARLSLCYNIV